MTLGARIAAAWSARDGLGECHRLLHGWGEGVPGIEIDRYGGAAVIEHSAELAPLLAEIVPALDACHRFDAVVARPRAFGDHRFHHAVGFDRVGHIRQVSTRVESAQFHFRAKIEQCRILGNGRPRYGERSHGAMDER